MKSKKVMICLTSVIVLVLLTFFTAYAQQRYLSIATGGTGGGYYPMGGALGELFSKQIPGVSSTAQVTAASLENIKLLNQNKCQVALLNAACAYGYVDKKIQQIKIEGISSIMSAGYADVVTVVLKNSPIKTMADLKGKRVGIGAPGSVTEVINKLVLTGWGLFNLETGQIDVVPEYLSYAETSTALKDRRVQAGMYFITGRPGPAIMDISITHDIRILGYEKEITGKIIRQFPFVSETVYQKGFYKGVDYDSLVVKVPDVLACRTDLPDDLVYQMTKKIHEALPELAKNSYAGFKVWELDRSVGGFVPMHPGAKRYYDELKIK